MDVQVPWTQGRRQRAWLEDGLFVWAWFWGIPVSVWSIMIDLGRGFPHAWRVTWTKHQAMWTFYWHCRS